MSSWISIAVLAVAPWPVYRLLAIPSFREYYFCYAVRAGCLIAAYAGVVALIAATSAELLVAAASGAALCLAGERWRARASFGQGRGLPPGRLGLVPRGPWIDDGFFAKQAAVYGPVFKVSQLFRPMVCVVGPELGIKLLTANGERLQPPQVRFSQFIPKGFIRYMAAADHTKYRAMFQKMINHTVIRDCAQSIDGSILRALENVAADSRTAIKIGHHPSDFLEPMLMEVFLRLFLGLAPGSPDYHQATRLFPELDIRKAACSSSGRDTRAANELAEIIRRHALAIHAAHAGKQSTPPCFLNEILESEPHAHNDQTTLLNLVYMMQVGRSDMRGFLTWVVKMLADNADWQGRLRALIDNEPGPPNAEVRALASRMVREALRLEQSEFIFRRATDDVEFQGFTIPQGWSVRICIREGHRDPTIFESPEIFDPDRFKRNAYTREAYSPLGLLSHSCLGGQVINSIGSMFILRLIGDFDFSVITDGPREYGQAHWQPNCSLRIALAPRHCQESRA